VEEVARNNTETELHEGDGDSDLDRDDAREEDDRREHCRKLDGIHAVTSYVTST
jgi:hypothetical protein